MFQGIRVSGKFLGAINDFGVFLNKAADPKTKFESCFVNISSDGLALNRFGGLVADAQASVNITNCSMHILNVQSLFQIAGMIALVSGQVEIHVSDSRFENCSLTQTQSDNSGRLAAGMVIADSLASVLNFNNITIMDCNLTSTMTSAMIIG